MTGQAGWRVSQAPTRRLGRTWLTSADDATGRRSGRSAGAGAGRPAARSALTRALGSRVICIPAGRLISSVRQRDARQRPGLVRGPRLRGHAALGGRPVPSPAAEITDHRAGAIRLLAESGIRPLADPADRLHRCRIGPALPALPRLGLARI